MCLSTNFYSEYKYYNDIDRGRYFKITKVQNKKTGSFFSAKIFQKKDLLDQKRFTKLECEVKTLRQMNSPYLLKLFEI